MRRTNWILAAGLWLITVSTLLMSDEEHIANYLHGIDKNMALYAITLFPLMLLAAWSSSLIQGTRNYDSYNKILLIQPITLCFLTIFLYVINSITVVTILTCYLLSNIALWLLSEIKINKINNIYNKITNNYLDSVKFGLLAHLCNVITFLNYRIDLYLVSYFLNSTATGKYSLSIMLAERLWLIAGAASMIIFPESAALSSNPKHLHTTVNKIAIIVFIITLAGAIIAAILSQYAIPFFFGYDYRDAVLPFIILLPGIVMWSYMSIISNSLAGLGRLKINITSSLISLIINVAGNIYAIPKYGINGAAFASTIGYTIAAIYTVLMYRKVILINMRSTQSI